MKRNLLLYTLLIPLLFSSKVSGESVGEYNAGTNWVHPSTLKLTGMNFINTAAGTLMNNGTIWYTGNFQNDGTIDYDRTLLYPGLSRFQGTSAQIISGTGTSSFYNLLFSGVSFSLQQTIKIANQIDFDKGIVTSQQTTPETVMNTVQMLAGSSWLNASDACYVDGFVQKTGNTAFTFPVGNGGYYRPAGISAATAATDVFSARYLYADPSSAGYASTLKADGVGTVSNKEYWIVQRTAGSATPQVTLSWNTAKTSASVPTDLTKVQVVRWTGTQWVSEGNISTTGNATEGSVTANVTGYGVFTLASVTGNVTAVPDIYTMVQNSTLTGNVSLNDLVSAGVNTWSLTVNPQHGSLTMQTNGTFIYTPDADYNGTDSFTYMLADASGSSSSATATITIQPISGYLLVNKHSSEPVLQGDGTFIWKYFITMTNVQTSPIVNVHVTDDLSKVFASPISFAVTGITATGNLNANALYDGVNHTNLLVDVSSLAANTKDSVTIELKVDPHEYVGPVYNQAEFDGTLGVLGVVSNVLSDDPANTGSTAARRPTVTNIPVIDIKIPNAFSPNNDGFNDKFVISTSSDVLVSFEVFNRWGAQVYKNKSYQNEWDGKGTGTLLGSDLSEGTYYYTVETTHKITHEVKKYSGFITLKR